MTPRFMYQDRAGCRRRSLDHLAAAVFQSLTVIVRRHQFAEELRPSMCELHLIRVGLPPSPAYVVFNIYRPQWMSQCRPRSMTN